eukprot:m.433329 g.433329  ORF g.433329 m.433329 type:complete len:57 (-) comp92378_c0_seq1:135-305(-)
MLPHHTPVERTLVVSEVAKGKHGEVRCLSERVEINPCIVTYLQVYHARIYLVFSLR